MKIVAEESLRGKTYNLPELGTVEIPADGIIELSDEVATLLVTSDIGYSFIGQKSKVEDKEDENKSEETNEVTNQFDSLSLNELIELAEASNLPEAEWRKFADNTKNPKLLMIKYLTKKIK